MMISSREESPIDSSGLYVHILSLNGQLWHGGLLLPTENIEMFKFFT